MTTRPVIPILAQQIAISCPGGDVSHLLSTTVNNSYGGAGGTSCATPIVASLLGLVKSYHPEWTSDQVITQVLGTADTIDYLNPGFENMLGSGRINAYRALTETGVTLEQEITVDFVGLTFQDSDNNNMLEAGDTASLNIKLRNYNYGVGADNATFILTTDDPEITILNDTYTADIPADNYFTLEDAFEFVISEETTTHVANFELITTADKEITWGDTIAIEVLVAPSGILVFQGEGTGNAYSGDFINENLIDQGFDVFYTSHFPSSLRGLMLFSCRMEIMDSQCQNPTSEISNEEGPWRTSRLLSKIHNGCTVSTFKMEKGCVYEGHKTWRN